jgi:hypothetical protein
MNIPLILVIVVCIIIICGFVAVFGLILRRKLKQYFEKIATSINGKVKTSFFGFPEIQGDYQNIPFKIKYITYEYTSDIKIEIFKEPSFKLSLRKENADTEISKKIGLAREFQIGIHDFDKDFFIQTDNNLKCQRYLSMPKIREIIKDIYDKDCSLKFTKKKIELIKGLKSGGALSLPKIKEEEIVELLKKAIFLAKELEQQLIF